MPGADALPFLTEHRWRTFAGAALFRVRGRSLRVVPDDDLRAAVPDAFPVVVGALLLDGRRWIIEEAPRGRRNASASANALLCWRLHAAGHTPREIAPDELLVSPAGSLLLQTPRPGTAEQLSRALVLLPTLTGQRRTTALGRAGTLAEVIAALVGPRAPRAMLRSALHPLPDVAAFQGWAMAALARARAGRPIVLPAADIAQGRALRALLCRLAASETTDGQAAGDGDILRLRGIRPGVLVRGPVAPDEAEAGLRQLSASPTVVIVPGAYLDLSRSLGALAEVAPAPELTPPGLLEWLKPLGLEAALVVQRLIPALQQDPANAARTMHALCERCEVLPPGARPTLQAGWEDELQHMLDRRGGARLVHPQGARAAALLAASGDGLDAAAVNAWPELARGAALLRDAGLAVLQRAGTELLRFAPGSRPETAVTRADLLWLAERPQLCPWPAGTRRDAWALALRLRAGDMAAWYDNGPAVLRALLDDAHYVQAAGLLEAHAVCAARIGAGPPDLETVLLAAELMLAAATPRRLRRLLHGWLARYDGELKALLLAVLARAERTLHGQAGYAPVLAKAEAVLAGGSRGEIGRVAAQNAWLEIASCRASDDDRGALAALARVKPPYAQAARLLVEARVLLVRAQCEFIGIRLPEALGLLQQAREQLHTRANGFLRLRIEGQLEAYTALYSGVEGRFRRDSDALLKPLRDLHERTACVGDLLAATVVNDSLFRMRTGEVGSATPADIEGVLASARPDNLRGYLIVLYQLAENALYRGDPETLRLLNARMHALNAGGRGNALVHASWQRHEALRHALAGNWADAVAMQRAARVHHLPPPFGPRSAMLRRGELGLLMLFAGKYRNAARLLWGAGKRLAAMSAGGRASPYALPCLLAKLLAGETPGPDLIESMQGYVRHGYVLARCVQAVAEADSLAAIDAPPAWTALCALAAALVARKQRKPEAHALAQLARRGLGPGFEGLRVVLEREFPGAARGRSNLSPVVLAALGELSLLPPDCAPDALARQFADVLARAFDCPAMVLLRVPEPAAAASGAAPADWRFSMAQACDLGDYRHDGLCALGLDGALGAVGISKADAHPSELEPFAIRLGHELEQRRDRAIALADRRRQHELALAGFALAGAGSGTAAKLDALAALVRAMAGAAQLELAVLRGRAVMLASGRVKGASHELQVPLDASLGLRARAQGGDREALQSALEAAAGALAGILRGEGERLRGGLLRADDGESVYAGEALIGTSPAAHRLYDELRRYADLELPVVITGESGSGKDFAAKALHLMSRRAGLPHVVVDCPTLRRETAASELFGHVTGAFTGAMADHAGMLERAGRGTLQLDAPGDLHPSIQPMLLRALQERSFLPVGALREREFRARLVITSARPLDQLVAEGSLREDLAQRLAGLSLPMPALRERGNDALALANQWLREQAAALGRALRFSPAAEALISSAPWPGNARELRHAVMRAAVLTDGPVVEMETGDAAGTSAEFAAGTPLANEPGLRPHARLILGALRAAGQAAPRQIAGKLGLSRTTVSTTLAALTRQGYARRAGKGRATVYAAEPAGGGR